MVDIEMDCWQESGVTLVQATVTNTRTTAQTVRLESQLSGPTWPPKRNGREIPEWSGDTWEAVVKPGRSRGLGFASPAPPKTQPLEIVSVTRATEKEIDTTDRLTDLEEWEPPSSIYLEER